MARRFLAVLTVALALLQAASAKSWLDKSWLDNICMCFPKLAAKYNSLRDYIQRLSKTPSILCAGVL